MHRFDVIESHERTRRTEGAQPIRCTTLEETLSGSDLAVQMPYRELQQHLWMLDQTLAASLIAENLETSGHRLGAY